MSAGVNKVILIGNLAADPKVNETKSGKCVANLRLAVQESKNYPAEFLDITVWDKAAEFARDYLSKGRQVYLEGRLKTEEWEKDGEKRRKTIVDSYKLLGLERNGRGGGDDEVPF